MIAFFLYELDTGVIVLLLPALPDNSDFETSSEIRFEGRPLARGLKWDAIGFEICEPVDIDPIPGKYLYKDGEISDNPDYQDPDPDEI